MAIKVDQVNFVVAQNSAVVLHPATSDEKTLRGLQGMGLCLGFTMNTVEVAEMGRRVALDVPSGGKFEKASVNYNFIPAEKTLEFFRSAAANGDKIADIRLYVKQGEDFSAPDLVSDPASGLYVGTVGDPKADSPSALYQGSLEYMPGGPFCLFVAHKVGASLSYTAATRTLTSSDSDFITKGFEEGDTVILDKVTGMSGPVYAQIATIAAGTITFTADAGTVALMNSDWSGAADTALHGATPFVVSDY